MWSGHFRPLACSIGKPCAGKSARATQALKAMHEPPLVTMNLRFFLLPQRCRVKDCSA